MRAYNLREIYDSRGPKQSATYVVRGVSRIVTQRGVVDGIPDEGRKRGNVTATCPYCLRDESRDPRTRERLFTRDK